MNKIYTITVVYIFKKRSFIFKYQSIFDDLEGEGIDGALADFYEAVNNLNEYPASSTARTNFIEGPESFTFFTSVLSLIVSTINLNKE